MNIRQLLTGGLLALCGAWALAAGTSPERPITRVVRFVAGGSTDVLARALVPMMARYLKLSPVPFKGSVVSWVDQDSHEGSDHA